VKTERALFSDKEGVKIIAVAIWQTGRRRLEKNGIVWKMIFPSVLHLKTIRF